MYNAERSYTIKKKTGHYEIFDKNGKFICSADNSKEAMKELESLLNQTNFATNRLQ